MWIILKYGRGDTQMENINRIKDLREDCDLTQAQVAQVLNCSQTCYSKYELGQRGIPIRLICLLADFYGVSTDYILGRTNIKKEKRSKARTKA